MKRPFMHWHAFSQRSRCRIVQRKELNDKIKILRLESSTSSTTGAPWVVNHVNILVKVSTEEGWENRSVFHNHSITPKSFIYPKLECRGRRNRVVDSSRYQVRGSLDNTICGYAWLISSSESQRLWVRCWARDSGLDEFESIVASSRLIRAGPLQGGLQLNWVYGEDSSVIHRTRLFFNHEYSKTKTNDFVVRRNDLQNWTS